MRIWEYSLQQITTKLDCNQFRFLTNAPAEPYVAILEEKILDSCRSLFKTLEQYRFIAERERIGLAANAGIKAGFTKQGKSDVLYALLPGLRCYRAEALSKMDMLGGPGVADGVPVADGDEGSEDDERIGEVVESVADNNSHQEGPMFPATSEETEA